MSQYYLYHISWCNVPDAISTTLLDAMSQLSLPHRLMQCPSYYLYHITWCNIPVTISTTSLDAMSQLLSLLHLLMQCSSGHTQGTLSNLAASFCLQESLPHSTKQEFSHLSLYHKNQQKSQTMLTGKLNSICHCTTFQVHRHTHTCIHILTHTFIYSHINTSPHHFFNVCVCVCVCVCAWLKSQATQTVVCSLVLSVGLL